MLYQFRRFLAISGDFGNSKSLPTHFTPLRRRRRSAKTNLQPATLRLNVPANGRIFWCWPFRVSPPAASVWLLTRIARCSLRRRSRFRLLYTTNKKGKSSTLTAQFGDNFSNMSPERKSKLSRFAADEPAGEIPSVVRELSSLLDASSAMQL